MDKEKQDIAAKQISEKKQDIKFDTRDYVIEYIVNKFKDGDFYIPGEYQRQFVWNDKDKCNFIESILMGLPIPFMFFSDTDDGRIEIVDGAQRTQTLVQFTENELELNGLRVLDSIKGFKFKDLAPAIQKRFLNSSIRVVFLEEGTTEKTRQEIFKRINTGGVHANPSETRRGSYDGEFKNFLEKCTKNETFNKLAPRTSLTEKRYEGFELVSRFFTYLNNYNNNFEDYTGNVATYIDDFIDNQNTLCQGKNGSELLNKYRIQFESMLKYAEELLGKRGFRKKENSKFTPRARFEALSVGIALALKEKPDLGDKDIYWLDSEEFSDITRSDAANNKNKLLHRINYVKDKLLEGE